MDIRIPSKKVCQEFHFTYELKGAQKGADVLARYYGIRRMKIVLNGRRVGNGFDAIYDKNVSYFKKSGLNKSNVLHEFFHHLVYVKKLEMTHSREEREANRFVRDITKKNIPFIALTPEKVIFTGGKMR